MHSLLKQGTLRQKIIYQKKNNTDITLRADVFQIKRYKYYI